MTFTRVTLLTWEFEYRIFVSLGIVAIVTLASLLFSPAPTPVIILLCEWLGCTRSMAVTATSIVLTLVIAAASVIRMAAGSALTSDRVMAFRVQTTELTCIGPYRISRNPIYLADFIALSGLALCLPQLGLIMPALFFIHYSRLISYEESRLTVGRESRYGQFMGSSPRFFPTWNSLGALPEAVRESRLTRDGIRHNALYVFFIPGFCVAAMTGHLHIALLIGLPGVLDWAIVHTRKGFVS
jgi:protein-S-isoprenylcysteine O-methyltransferase Ste14